MIRIKPNKEQRHFFYVILREEAKQILKDKIYGSGLCNLSREIIDVYPNEDKRNCNYTNDALFNIFYPELLSLKPNIDNDSAYWFRTNRQGWKQRIALLDEAIKMTE